MSDDIAENIATVSAIRRVLERDGYEESQALSQEKHFRVKWLYGEQSCGPLYFRTLAEAEEKTTTMIAEYGAPIRADVVPAGVHAFTVYMEEFDGRHNWRRVPGSVRERWWREDLRKGTKKRELAAGPGASTASSRPHS